MWNFQIYGCNDNSKSIFRYIKFSDPPVDPFFSGIWQLYRMRAKSNNRKIVISGQMFIFKWRFICRRRRGCLRSLISELEHFLEDGLRILLRDAQRCRCTTSHNFRVSSWNVIFLTYDMLCRTKTSTECLNQQTDIFSPAQALSWATSLDPS